MCNPLRRSQIGGRLCKLKGKQSLLSSKEFKIKEVLNEYLAFQSGIAEQVSTSGTRVT